MGSCLRLRGGEFDIAKLDARLRDEILLDCERRKEGKLPMFIENIGKEAGSLGSIRYADGVEAMMPPAINGGDNDEMGSEKAEQETNSERQPTEQQKQEETLKMQAKEMAEAKEWFATIDKRYFTEDDGEERFLGHRGIWQKRELEADEDLEAYFEAREDAQVVDQFLKSIPADLKPNSPELRQWLDDYGWNDIILRNGTRLKWNSDMVFDPEEEDNEPNGEWNWAPPIDKNLTWFNATVRGLVEEAWDSNLTAAEAATFFRKHNATMFDLAVMHTLLRDGDILTVRDELEATAEGVSLSDSESEDWEEDGSEEAEEEHAQSMSDSDRQTEAGLTDADQSTRPAPVGDNAVEEAEAAMADEPQAERERSEQRKSERSRGSEEERERAAARESGCEAAASPPSVEELIEEKGAMRAWQEHFMDSVKSDPRIHQKMLQEDLKERLQEEYFKTAPKEEIARQLEKLAIAPSDAQRRLDVVDECFKLLLVKWREFYNGPVYREDIVAALDKAEASFRGRHGSKAAAYFAVPRPRDYYADPADD